MEGDASPVKTYASPYDEKLGFRVEKGLEIGGVDRIEVQDRAIGDVAPVASDGEHVGTFAEGSGESELRRS